jgi:Flp pilus assembly pilin Flp
MRSGFAGRSTPDRGASMIEWGVLLLLISAILGAVLFVGIPGDVATNVKAMICRIFGGNCDPATARDQDFKPKLCEVSSEQTKFGATVKVAVVKIGDEYSFLRQEMADGSVRLTVVPTTGELGLETGVGGKLSLGKNLKLGADITVGASVKLGVGDTYVFPNTDEANKFEGDIKELSYRDAAKDIAGHTNPILNNPLGGWVLDRVDDATGRPDIKDPEITATTITYKEAVEGTLGLYLPQLGSKPDGSDDWNYNLNTGVKVKGERGGDVVVTQDRSNPNDPKTSYLVSLQGTIGGSGSVLGAGGGGDLKWTGGQRMVFDKDGKLTAVVYQTTFEKGWQASGLLGGNVKDTKGKGKATGTDKTVETVTTTIPITSDAERAAMTQYLTTHPYQLPENLLRYMGGDDNVITTDPGPGANVLDRLMYQNGQVLKQQYDSDVDSFEVGAEGKLGLELGAEVKSESTRNHTTSAQYLGAPQNGQRQYLPYSECVK